MAERCFSCGDELGALDAYPNGDLGCNCARCRAEYNHDFSRFPDVLFERDGSRLDLLWDDPLLEKVVYVAVPSKGVFTQRENGLYEVSERFLKALAHLHEKYPRSIFISQSLEGYQFIRYMAEQDSSYEAWKHRCRLLLKRSDLVLVLPFSGWRSSSGISGELAIADELRRPIRFFDLSAVS